MQTVESDFNGTRKKQKIKFDKLWTWLAYSERT